MARRKQNAKAAPAAGGSVKKDHRPPGTVAGTGQLKTITLQLIPKMTFNQIVEFERQCRIRRETLRLQDYSKSRNCPKQLKNITSVVEVIEVNGPEKAVAKEANVKEFYVHHSQFSRKYKIGSQILEVTGLKRITSIDLRSGYYQERYYGIEATYKEHRGELYYKSTELDGCVMEEDVEEDLLGIFEELASDLGLIPGLQANLTMMELFWGELVSEFGEEAPSLKQVIEKKMEGKRNDDSEVD